jgi:hypothetical protein
MKTINYCGDSFCKTGGTVGDYPDVAWTTLLAKQLDAKIIGLGKSGTAHENAIQSFVDTADYTVFCWTEPHRLWHPKYPINMARADRYKKELRIYAVADLYYKYLHDTEYAIERFQRDCYWFDNAVLSKYKHKCIHLNSFHNWYDWTSGIAHQLGPLNSLRTVPGNYSDDEVANHFTKQQNEQLADELYYIFTKDIK